MKVEGSFCLGTGHKLQLEKHRQQLSQYDDIVMFRALFYIRDKYLGNKCVDKVGDKFYLVLIFNSLFIPYQHFHKGTCTDPIKVTGIEKFLNIRQGSI